MHTEVKDQVAEQEVPISLEYGSYSQIARICHTSASYVEEIATGGRPANSPRAKMILQVIKQTAKAQQETKERIKKFIHEQEA